MQARFERFSGVASACGMRVDGSVTLPFSCHGVRQVDALTITVLHSAPCTVCSVCTVLLKMECGPSLLVFSAAITFYNLHGCFLLLLGLIVRISTLVVQPRLPCFILVPFMQNALCTRQLAVLEVARYRRQLAHYVCLKIRFLKLL